jgi:hypothetical protein
MPEQAENTALPEKNAGILEGRSYHRERFFEVTHCYNETYEKHYSAVTRHSNGLNRNRVFLPEVMESTRKARALSMREFQRN